MTRRLWPVPRYWRGWLELGGGETVNDEIELFVENGGTATPRQLLTLELLSGGYKQEVRRGKYGITFKISRLMLCKIECNERAATYRKLGFRWYGDIPW